MRILIPLILLAWSDLSDAEFKRLHQELHSQKPEAWQSVPWETSLGTAVRRAVHEKKPLLLWARMGNPLVCT